MITPKEYIKKLTSVPEKFIDELFDLYNENTMQSDFVIRLDLIAKWLDSNKYKLIITLKKTYKLDIDYIVKKPLDIIKKHPSSNNNKLYLLTPDCFKRLAMMSKSKNADMVRTYFIEIENLFIKYRQYTLESMRLDIERLEKNQKSNKYPTGPGFVYIIKASPDKSLYKIGRTKDLANRLRTYQTGVADDIEVLYLYKTEDKIGVEKCVKQWLTEKKYRKYKEVYSADLSMIKELINKCGSISSYLEYKKKKEELKGGYYIAITNI
jgi:phage anti-repressor protein